MRCHRRCSHSCSTAATVRDGGERICDVASEPCESQLHCDWKTPELGCEQPQFCEATSPLRLVAEPTGLAARAERLRPEVLVVCTLIQGRDSDISDC